MKNLKVISFNFSVDDNKLNTTPLWIEKYVSDAMKGYINPKATIPRNNSSGNNLSAQSNTSNNNQVTFKKSFSNKFS